MSDTSAVGEIFRFGPYVLDVRKGTLTDDGKAIFLRPTPYAVLVHLARNIERVVPKAELFEAVWPDVHVTEDSLVQSIREIRRGLGDAEQDRVRTVSRRGYLLTGQGDPPAAERSKRPIVAVLRFRNEGDEEARRPIVDGFADDIISNLARYDSVTVLARNSTFHFPSHEPNSRLDAATRVGADFVVEGSVRWSERDAVVSVNLVDAKTQALLWSDRYEAHDVPGAEPIPSKAVPTDRNFIGTRSGPPLNQSPRRLTGNEPATRKGMHRCLPRDQIFPCAPVVASSPLLRARWRSLLRPCPRSGPRPRLPHR